MLLLFCILSVSGLTTWSGIYVSGFRIGGWMWLVAAVLAAAFVCAAPARIPAIFLGYVPFMCFMLLGIASAGFPFKAFQNAAQLAAPVVAGILAYNAVSSSEGLKQVLKAACVALLLVAIAFLVLPMGPKEGLSFSRRPSATVATWCMALFMFYYLKNRAIALLVPAAILLAFLPGSRTGTFLMIGMLSLWPARRFKIMVRVAFLAGVAIVALLAFYSETMQERFFRYHGGKGGVEELKKFEFSTMGRERLWPIVWEASLDAPLVGHGAGSVHKICRENTGGVMEHPHNDYLKIFYEYGILGSCLFWGFFIIVFLSCWSTFRRDPTIESKIAAGSAAVIILGFFAFSVTDNPVLYTVHWMVPMFVMVSVSEKLREISQSTGISQ
jgi:hypothetical protein